MATDAVEEMSGHRRGLTVTTLAAMAGILAAFASQALTGGDPGARSALAIVLGAIVVQFPILHVLGIEYDGLSLKDKVYVAFMTFALWFVSWGILLTTSTV